MMKTMWPDRRLIDVLQIEHPIVLSPMASFGTVDLAAAVSAAGGSEFSFWPARLDAFSSGEGRWLPHHGVRDDCG